MSPKDNTHLYGALIACLLIFSLLVVIPVSPAAADGRNWSHIDGPGDLSYTNIAFGDGVFVATSITDGQELVRSTDMGHTWAAISSPGGNDDYWHIAYGNGVFIAVARVGSDPILRSDDGGLSWDSISDLGNPAADTWFDVAYGDGVWIAVGLGTEDEVLRSTDNGLSWTPVDGDGCLGFFYGGVAYGDGVWVALSTTPAGNGECGSSRGMRSIDGGLTWVPITDKAPGTGVSYGNGVWISVSETADDQIQRSTDGGQSWTTIDLPDSADLLLEVIYYDGVWVAATYVGANIVWRSTDDGITWTGTPETEEFHIYGVAAGDNTLIAVSKWGVVEIARSEFAYPSRPNTVEAVSANGKVLVSWAAPSSTGSGGDITRYKVTASPGGATCQTAGVLAAYPLSCEILGLRVGSSYTFAVTATNSGGPSAAAQTDALTVTSAGGLSWELQGHIVGPDHGFESVAYGDGVWVAVGGVPQGLMRSVDDGITWLDVTDAEGSEAWYDVEFGNGVWVAVGTYKKPIRSTDGGVTWDEVVTADSSRSLRNVDYGDGVWIVTSSTGDLNRVLRSTDDGQNWNAIAAPILGQWWGLDYGEGVWIAAGSFTSPGSPIMRSIDGGATWTSVFEPGGADGTDSYLQVAYGDGAWVILSMDGNKAMRSTDRGVTWSLTNPLPNPVETVTTWWTLEYADGAFIAGQAGPSLFMSRSTDGGATWHLITTEVAHGNVYAVGHGDGTWIATAGNLVFRSTDRLAVAQSGCQEPSSGDFDGDGRMDIVSYNSLNGEWTVSRSTGIGFVASVWADFSTNSGWGLHCLGDFNGDGRDDIVSYHETSGTWWVNRSTGTSFSMELWATFNTRTGWSPQFVGDFNGDGMDDIVSYHEASGRWWVNKSTGTAFNLEWWATFNTRTGWSPQMIGDFNGDGVDDVVSFHETSGRWWVNRSTGDGFNLEWWDTFSTRSGWDPQIIGDFNGDGKDDMASYHTASSAWWVSISGNNTFATTKWIGVS